MQDQLNFIFTEIRSAWRFRWLALGVAWLVCLGGWAAVSLMPDVYQASARVYVDTSSQLRRILSDRIIEPDIESQLNFVREALLGRQQMEHVIRNTGLIERLDSPSDIVQFAIDLRKEIELEVQGDPRGRVRDNMYTLRYKDTDPAVALDVVNTLLNAFVEDALGRRRDSSDSARRFLELQVRDVGAQLAAAEQQLADFKRANAEVLPGSEGDYFSRLQTEIAELDNVRHRLELAEARRNRLRDQIAGETPLSGPESREIVPGSIEARLLDAENRLADLRMRYTDAHPDVEGLLDNIERLRAQRDEQRARASGGAAAAGNSVYEALLISMNEVEVDIASINAELVRRQARVDRLRASMEEIPQVEAEHDRLVRLRDDIHRSYQSLVQSLETERLTREASETEQIEFTVIDPPTVPDDPVAPKRAFMLFAVFCAGLGGGGGFAWLLAQFKPIFSDPRTLREITGLPVAGIVSRTWKQRHRVRRRMEVASLSVGLLLLAVVFGGVFFFEVMGPGLRSLIA